MKTTLYIKFDAQNIPGGARTILDPVGLGEKDVDIDVWSTERIRVEITLDENDPRVPHILGLLDLYKEEMWLRRSDIYTEDELQAAPLLVVYPDGSKNCLGGPREGTSYDMSKACGYCGAGARQTSDMFIDGDDLKTIKNTKLAATYYDDLLLDEIMAEKLIAAKPSGLSLRNVFANMKDGSKLQLKRKQLIAEHTMPPMAPSSLLSREDMCAVCKRGGIIPVWGEPTRFVYRPEDLVGIQDVNVTWEWMGQIREFKGDMSKALFPYPLFLVTPKVMNLLRAPKRPDEIKFVPIWIEGQGDAGAKPPYLPDHPLNAY